MSTTDLSTAPSGGPVTVPAGGPRRPRWPVVLLVVGVVVSLAAGAAGLYALRRVLAGAPDAVVAHVPADAVLYAHVNLRPSAGNLVGLASLAARLDEATGEDVLDPDRLAEEVEGTDDVVWEADVRPWLGSQAGVFVLPPADGEGFDGTDAALVALVRDRDDVATFVAEHVRTTGAWEAGDGAQGWRIEGEEDGVVALTDDVLALGTVGAVEAALRVGEDSLGERTDYRDLVDELPASVATGWVDVAAATEVARTETAGLGSVPPVDPGVRHAAFGLSLSSGAVDVTTLVTPSDPGAARPPVASRSLSELPPDGLAYLRVPDLGRSLADAVAGVDAGGGPGDGPSARQSVDEALAPLGTDLDALAGLLGDVVATVAYDPAQERDNLSVTVRAGVSDDAAAVGLVDALAAGVPQDGGTDVAPGSVATGSLRVEAAEGGVALTVGGTTGGTLGDDAVYQAAVDGLPGEPLAYVQVARLVRAVAPLAAGDDPTAEDVGALEVLGAFDHLVVTSSRSDDGVSRGALRLGWGEPLQPLDLDAPSHPPHADLGVLGEPAATLPGNGQALPAPDEGPGAAADTYGDDPALDALWDACGTGDLAACDDLYLSSGVGTDYEAFALTCGGRAAEDVLGCAGALEP